MLALDQIANIYGESMALVVQCCRVHFKTDSIEQLNARIQAIEETNRIAVLKKVQLLSRLHRIRPVVYRVLLNTFAPEEFKTSLKNELHSITLQNFSLAKETERIVKKLDNKGITAIPYKGVAYSQQFYGDISMRESSDIDLAIDSNDLLAIQPLLEEDGFSIAAGMGNPTKAGTDYYTLNKDLCFDKITITERFHVELHWMITHPTYQAPANLNRIEITQTTKCELAGTTLKFFEPAEHYRAALLHHFLHDGMEYLKLPVDIAQAQLVLRGSEGNAEENNDTEKYDLLVREKILQLEQHYNVIPILQAIEELFGIKSIFKQQSKNALTNSIIAYCLHSTIGRYRRFRVFSLLRHYLRSLQNRVRFIKNNKDQRRFQVSYLRNLIKPGLGEKEWIPLPKYLYGLYYLIRPIRILLRGKADA